MRKMPCTDAEQGRILKTACVCRVERIEQQSNQGLPQKQTVYACSLIMQANAQDHALRVRLQWLESAETAPEDSAAMLIPATFTSAHTIHIPHRLENVFTVDPIPTRPREQGQRTSACVMLDLLETMTGAVLRVKQGPCMRAIRHQVLVSASPVQLVFIASVGCTTSHAQRICTLIRARRCAARVE